MLCATGGSRNPDFPAMSFRPDLSKRITNDLEVVENKYHEKSNSRTLGFANSETVFYHTFTELNSDKNETVRRHMQEDCNLAE